MSEETDTLEDRIDRLEAVIEDQQETIERQNERIEELDSEESTTAEDDGITVSRRGALAAGGVLGLLGLGAGTAGANPTGTVGTASSPLETLYTAELDGPLTSDMVNTLAGDGLEIANNALQVNVGDSLSTGDDGSLNAECEWVRDTYEIHPADDLVHTVNLDGRRMIDRAAERAIYHSDHGLNSDALDIDWVNIAGNEVSLGGGTSIQHNRLTKVEHDQHHAPGDGLVRNPDTGNYDINPDDFAGHGLGVDTENNLEVTSSGSAAWSEGDATLEPANNSNYSSIDMKANDIIDSTSGTTIYDAGKVAIPGGVIADSSVTETQLANNLSISLSQITGDVVTDPVTQLDGSNLTIDPETGSFNVDTPTLAGDALGASDNSLHVNAGPGLTVSARQIEVYTKGEGGGGIARGKVRFDGTELSSLNLRSITVNAENDQFTLELNRAPLSSDPYQTVVTPILDRNPTGDSAIDWAVAHDASGDYLTVTVYFSRKLGMTDREGFQFITTET